MLKSIELIMREVGNLKRIGEQFSAQDSGTLSIATTHTQARYVLPIPVAKLREAFPKVSVSLHQGSPDQVARMVMDEVAEIGIATERWGIPGLVTRPVRGSRVGCRSRKVVRRRHQTSNRGTVVTYTVIHRPHAPTPRSRQQADAGSRSRRSTPK